jgi:hypothetical protein
VTRQSLGAILGNGRNPAAPTLDREGTGHLGHGNAQPARASCRGVEKGLSSAKVTNRVRSDDTPNYHPDSFDPNTASQDDLVKQGLRWTKPTAHSAPEVRAAWEKFFSRKWLAKDRIIPELHPQIGRTHNYRGPAPKKHKDGTYTGTVWSGAGIKTGTWTSIVGFWHIPTVSKPSEPQGTEGGWNSASWLGLDGYSVSDDVVQAGVQQHVNSSGVARYVAWFEWYAPEEPGSPGYIYQTNIPNFLVSPGQQVYCAVQYHGKTSAMI